MPKGTYVCVAEPSGRQNYLITYTTTKILPPCFRPSFLSFLTSLNKESKRKADIINRQQQLRLQDYANIQLELAQTHESFDLSSEGVPLVLAEMLRSRNLIIVTKIFRQIGCPYKFTPIFRRMKTL